MMSMTVAAAAPGQALILTIEGLVMITWEDTIEVEWEEDLDMLMKDPTVGT